MFDHGIVEGDIHRSIRRHVMAQIGMECLETSHYHYCEERDLPKRHLLLKIYVCIDYELGN